MEHAKGRGGRAEVEMDGKKKGDEAGQGREPTYPT